MTELTRPLLIPLRLLLLILLLPASLSSMAAEARTLQEAFQKSISYEKDKNLDDAISVLKPFISTNTYEVYARLGWLYYSDGKHSESVSCYRKAIALKPNATEPLWGITYPLAELKQWKDLQAIYQKILSLDPKNTIATYRLGLGAYYDKNYALAKQYFDAVLRLYPLDYSSLLMSAWTNYFLGNKTAARSLFNKVLMIVPNDKSAQEGLSLCK